jgi:ketopantoate reductase
MRKNRALDILPTLAANKQSPNILFLMNNAAGPGALVDALGPRRALTGFPSSAGYFEEHVVVYLGGSEKRQMSIPIGEVDGRITGRTRQIARILESMPGYKVDIRTDMDDWHKSHVAVLMPGIGAALYACGGDRLRMARTRDALVLAIRATRDAFRVLRALHVHIVPTWVRLFDWLPEPLMVFFLRRLLRNERMKVALEGHAGAARDEIQHLVDELLALARSANRATPDIDRLYRYFDPTTPLIPDGSREMSMRW